MGLLSNKSRDASNASPGNVVARPMSVNAARRRRRWSTFASVLVVSLLVITSLLLFRHYSTAIASNIPTGQPIGASAGTPVLAQNEVNGLETTLSITPGPYFLSELLSVDITLTNHSQQDLMLGGALAINMCNGAFSVTIAGGQDPRYALPGNNFMMSCPPGMSTLARQKSLSVHAYIPLTSSGAVSVVPEVSIITFKPSQNGMSDTEESNPLYDHWPTIAITVAAQIPSDRLLSLQAQGNDVLVDAPASVRPHLVYFYTVSCLHGSGTNDGWDPLKTTILQEPSCDDLIRHWVYAVSAPGYAVAAILMGL